MGEVHVDPDPDTLAQLRARQDQQAVDERSLDEYRRGPAVTADGVRIRLEGNIQAPGDVRKVREQGGDGVGLFRSEFLLAEGGQAALTEESQYRAYRTIVEGMAPGRVTSDRVAPGAQGDSQGLKMTRSSRCARLRGWA